MKRSVFLEKEGSRKRRKRRGTEMKVNKRDKEERQMISRWFRRDWEEKKKLGVNRSSRSEGLKYRSELNDWRSLRSFRMRRKRIRIRNMRRWWKLDVRDLRRIHQNSVIIDTCGLLHKWMQECWNIVSTASQVAVAPHPARWLVISSRP